MRISDWSSDVCSSDLLTLHGVAQNEDGSYSWKFDNYVRPISPVDVTLEEMRHLWSRITCPVLHVYGQESWAISHLDDGRMDYFPNARTVPFKPEEPTSELQSLMRISYALFCSKKTNITTPHTNHHIQTPLHLRKT